MTPFAARASHTGPRRPASTKPPPTGRRSRDAQATREALLTAGSRLFAERGFDGVTVESIARDAGTTKAMINYHFGGKRKLYRAVLTSTFDEITSRLEGLRASARPADECLREFVGTFGQIAITLRPNFPAMLLREVLAGGRLLDREVLGRILDVFAVSREIVERGICEGRFRRVDPVLTHLSLIGSLAFFFATAPFRERVAAELRLPLPAPDAGTFVAHVQELLARGLAADPAAEAPAPPR